MLCNFLFSTKWYKEYLKKSFPLIRKMAYTVSSQVNSLEENDLGYFSRSFIHESFDLKEMRASS
jgi:hypothetical protein